MTARGPMPVGRQILFTFGTLCAILLTIGGLLFFSLRSIEHKFQTQQSRALKKLALIDDMAQDVAEMQAEALRQILASDTGEIKVLDQSVHDLEKINAREFADYSQLVDTEKEKRLYDRAMQTRKTYWEQTQPVLALGLLNQDIQATKFINSRQAPAYDEFLTAIKGMASYEELNADETARATTRFISRTRIIGNILIGVAILIAIGTGFAVARVARRLKEDNKTLQTEVNERKQAEEELRWKTAFLEAQVNATIDGILVVDGQGKKILQNQRLADLFKFPPHIANSKDDEEQIRWVTNIIKYPGQFVERITYLYSHPDEISRDEIELKDGTMLDRYSSPVVDVDGQYYGRIWTFRDITERKRMEESIRESEERFSGAFVHAPIGVALASPDGRWLKVNRALCDLVGYSEDELLTRTFRDITHPEDLEATLENVRHLIAGEIPSYQTEKRYIHARGHLVTILLNVSLVRDSQGQPHYFIAQIQDITQRKRAEESLRLLSSAVEQSKESIVITDADLDLPGPRILFVNPAFARMTGYSAEEAIGKTPRILQGPLTDRTVLSRLRQNLEGGETFEGEAVNYRKDGKEFDLEWQIAPLRDAGGKVTHFVAIQRDVTQRKRLEAQLLQSQKLETVGKLAGGIAHEFNSILTAILGQSELLLDDLPPESPLTKSAIEISKAAGRAATLTRQLLAYGRKQMLQPETLDLNRILMNMEPAFRHLMGGGVNTQIVPAPGLHAVKADAGQIEQVLMNMVINAHDAMPNGGKLILETANVSFDEESVGCYPELKPGEYVMLAVTDTGAGMSAEVKGRVFEPFFSTKGVGQGTGLGLSTCYGIIKQSGGHISVYSELARGSTFKIYLPQVEREASIPAQRHNSPDLPRGTETILLVEDDPALCEMAATLLRRLGYTVFAAANGIEALSIRQRWDIGHIDLLFTDVVMPHMSGKELAERVRALYPHTRILFTSAYTENAIVHQGVLDKGVSLLQKPFTPSALARKLREVLDQPA